MMISAPAQVLQQFVGDRGELGLVAQELVADAVDLERVLVAVALGVQVEVLVVAGELAGDQLHAADFDDAVAGFGGQAGGFGVEDDLAHGVSWRSQWFSLAWLIEYFGISTTRSFCATMAWQRQARVRLQAPGAVEQVFLVLVHLVERAEALAHDHVAGGAGAAHVAGVLDVDVVVQQRLADRGAGGRLDLGALRAVLGMGQDLDDGHGSDGLDVLARPGPCGCPGSCAAAAKASVPLASACGGGLDDGGVVAACARSRAACAISASIALALVGSSRSPSASSALCVASSMRSASTRASASARAFMSCSAVVKLSCSIVAIWSSDRP